MGGYTGEIRFKMNEEVHDRVYGWVRSVLTIKIR